MAAFAETEMLLADPALSADQRRAAESIKQALQRISEILHRLSTLKHDQTTEYPGGLEMIDLSRRNRATPVQAGGALLWLANENLARVVGLLLKHAGFAVERIADSVILSRRATEPGMALVVLLGNETPGVDPLGGFRPAPGHRYTLVALVSGDGEPARAAGADHIVHLPFDPGTFTGELLAAMRG
jgi:hypothetical protein